MVVIHGKSLRDLMTREVLTVDAETLLTEIANLFIVHRIRRLPVLHEGELVGQISRRDIIRFAVQNQKLIKEDIVVASGAIG